MSKQRPHQPGGSDRDRDREQEYSEDHGHEFENDKGNAAHIEIEERRFRGGLPPTPELYALARERWNQLPGSVVRSPMDPVAGNPPADSKDQPAAADQDQPAGADKDDKDKKQEGSR